MINKKISLKELYDNLLIEKKVLMGFCGLWIVVFHYWKMLFSDVPILFEISNVIIHSGRIAVFMFVFLSGVTIPYSYDKSKNVLEFYYKRIKRLVIPTFIASIFTSIVYHWSINTWIKNLFGISFITTETHSFLWFVYVIMTLYLLFPIYYFFSKRIKNRKIYYSFLLIIVFVINNIIAKSYRNDFLSLTSMIPIFVCGIEFTNNREYLDVNVNNSILIATLLLICCIIAYQITFYNISPYYCFDLNSIHYSLVSILLCFELPIFLSKSTYLKMFFSFLGSFSLELYSATAPFSRMFKTLYSYMIISVGSESILIKSLFNIIMLVFSISVAYIVNRLNNIIWRKKE